MEQKKIFLKDYQPPNYQVESVDLFFDIQATETVVTNTTIYIKNPKSISKQNELFLDGFNLNLVSIEVNNKNFSDYSKEANGIFLKNLPDQFTLKITTQIDPFSNTSLEGLYLSGKHLVTQCEAQGFRKITYFQDRPDVLTKYSVEIEADKTAYPVLLSNGEPKPSQRQPKNSTRHAVRWEDPHKKPCYLFALFAGDVDVIEDTFMTKSNQQVKLQIFAEKGKTKRCFHAMESLKKSMTWDEVRFGREYDLSHYMIVAIDDFNAGAMENKGLNIFNSRLVLADPETATDSDYQAIESVVAHEYFHNWTGNRVTLRDWFQLSLKEGLTVFRDQEFSGDQSDTTLQRITDVITLRERQFTEDAGPNAHPVRPESCYAVDNFFTMTIYEKGSEVIRMMQTIVGRPGFRKGMDLYFKRHDGQAVTTDDFAQAIADANNIDFTQFKRWYTQAGTPKVSVKESWNPDLKKYELILKQSCAPTPNQNEKLPFVIPLQLGLMTKTGQEISINHPQVIKNTESKNIFLLSDSEAKISFENFSEKPISSLFREFSAPVTVDYERPDDELCFLMTHDQDGFNRFEASQTLSKKILLNLMYGFKKPIPPSYIEAWSSNLKSNMDSGLKKLLLELPLDLELLMSIDTFEPANCLEAKKNLITLLVSQNRSQMLSTYRQWHGVDTDKTDSKTAGHRSLKNFCLLWLCFLEATSSKQNTSTLAASTNQIDEAHAIAWKQLTESKNMTDQVGALVALSYGAQATEAFEFFYKQWSHEPLILNKWFAIQARQIGDPKQILSNVKNLFQHSAFNIKNPNNVYSLMRSYGDNITMFHAEHDNIYHFFFEKMEEIDKLNPQVSARLASAFGVYKKLTPSRQKKIQELSDDLLKKKTISKNLLELIEPLKGK